MAGSDLHQVFISWSGSTSNRLAHALYDWISIVIQSSQPFMSQSDIEPGTRGLSKIADELDDAKVGLLCVTADNQDSRWLNFEAGAISKQVEESKVIPILLDLEPGELSPPISQFQAVRVDNKESMRTVAATINRSLVFTHPLRETTLEKSFDMAWLELEKRIADIRATQELEGAPDTPKRSTEDMFQEIVVSLRDISGDLEALTSRPRRPEFAELQMELANKAIRQIAAAFDRRDITDASALAELAEGFDSADWRAIDAAPFLRWYFEAYHGIVQPSNAGSGEASSDISEVPF